MEAVQHAEDVITSACTLNKESHNGKRRYFLYVYKF